MDVFLAELSKLFTTESILKIIKILVYIFPGYFFFQLIAFITVKFFGKRFANKQVIMLMKRVIVYFGFVVIVFLVLNELGVNLQTILGAAGIVGIAVGIASQNSLGNIISGLFLIAEKAFEVGDLVKVNDQVGIVDSIDLLSIRLKTFDNLSIRVPNQNIINSNLINYSRFLIRRIDFEFRIAYSSDLDKVFRTLNSVAAKNIYAFKDPDPIFVINHFEDYGIKIMFGVWANQSDYLSVKNSMSIELLQAFKENDIHLGTPDIIVHTDSERK